MKLKEKAKELVDDMYGFTFEECRLNAIACVKNEYYSNRELLYNLKSSGIEISEKVYLSRIQGLIDEEKLLIEEIEKL